MLIPVLRFFQRYAFIFAIIAGLYVRDWAVPGPDQRWLKAAVMFAVTGAVYFLLYKDGVTANRRGEAARLRIIEIIGLSALYWCSILGALFLFSLVARDSVTDWVPFGQGLDWRTVLVIAALALAATVYALGLRSAIRNRRHFWS